MRPVDDVADKQRGACALFTVALCLLSSMATRSTLHHVAGRFETLGHVHIAAQ